MEQAIAVEGRYIARILDEFNLSSLNAAILGNDRFTEVYIKTESGNMYLIHKPMSEFMQKSEWTLVNVRDCKKIYCISDIEMENIILKKGEPLRYGMGGRTTAITEIICINTGRCYEPSYLAKITGGNKSDIRNDFAKEAIGLVP